MTTVTTTLVSGQNAYVGAISSRGEYSVSVNSGVQGPQGNVGVSITAANAASGNLVLTLSNTSTIDAGPLPAAVANTGNISFNDTTINAIHTNTSIVIQTTNYNPSASPAINSTSSWTFGYNGTLTLPGNNALIVTDSGVDLTAGNNGWAELQSNNRDSYLWVDDGGAYVGTNWSNGAHQWTFSNTGGFTFPDNTTQTTAFTGNANNASYLGGVAAAQYAYANQISTPYRLANSSYYLTLDSNGVVNVPTSFYSTGQVFAAYNTSLLLGTSSHFIQVRGSDAALVFADYTVQSTAFTGSFDQLTAGIPRLPQYTSATNAIHAVDISPGGTASRPGAMYFDTGSNVVRAWSSNSSTWLTFATTADLASYQTTAGLSANVAALTANNTSFVGTVSAANVVSNSQLSSNLANYATTASLSSYQTTAGLSANVATLSSNNASYLGGVAAASYANTSGSYTFTGVHTYNANVAFGSTITISGNAAATFGNTTINGTVTATGNITGNTAGFTIGYLDVPQNYTNTSFTIALTDRGKHIYTSNGTSQTITIANNTSVAFPIGTAINIVSQGAGTITIARGTGVSLYLAANSTSADRTLASYGMASLLKVNTDTWFISGAGVT